MENYARYTIVATFPIVKKTSRTCCQIFRLSTKKVHSEVM